VTIFINILTISRIIASALIFILMTFSEKYYLMLFLFFYASITDYFDGYLARKYDSQSLIGEILDPIADKILVIFVLIALSVNLSSYYIGFLSALIISREVWVAALRDINSRRGKASATKVSKISKAKTSLQMLTILVYLSGLAFNFLLLIIIGDLLLMISFLITFYTGYLYTRSSFL
jgi:CDP-diacylglycerol--glycerol-3-phosphate 3-phosphatidyltransferase